jgi:pimeloyl-ACP methyl ester carboxylesterase
VALTAAALLSVTAALAAADAPPAPVVPAAEAPTRTLRAGSRTFGYRDIGRGRPVVLVQGLSGTIDGWDPTFVDTLVRAGHRVVLFDNAGIGRTAPLPGTLTIRAMGDDTHRLIRGLRLERPDVIGWSMGGMIAQSLAVRHPRSIRRLVLLASAPGDGAATPPTPEGVAALTGTGAATDGDALFPAGQDAARRRFFRNLARRHGAGMRAPLAVVQRQIAAAGGWLSGADPDGRRIRRLRMPVLVGGGELDPLLPVANQRHLARVIPNARLVTYADAAHAFFLQRSRDFTPRLRRFLRR